MAVLPTAGLLGHKQLPFLANGSTSTAYAAAANPPSINFTGHVTFQGRGNPPSARWSQTFSVSLLSSGGVQTDSSVTTDQNGYFILTLPASGTYDWYIKGAQTLANSALAQPISNGTQVEMGLQLTGDADNNNCASAVDVNIVRNAYGSSPGYPTWDARADFGGDNVVSAPDFAMLKANFGMCGAAQLGHGPTATSSRTNTPVPPTATNTNTPPAATFTRTNTPLPATATPTNTPPPATATRTNTAAATATATRTNTAQPTATPASGLPPIPAGVPNFFSFGLANSNTSDLPSGVPMNYRYQYLSGGANTGNGWATWQSNGGFATSYINSTRALGMTPAFIYYQILQSAPNYDEYSNFQDASTMRSYYDDFKLLMQKCGQAGGNILVDIEPDLNGVMQVHPSNTNDDASLQPVQVGSSGQADVAGIANNYRGFYQALAHLRDVYAPNVTLGIDICPWGAGDDIVLALRNNPSYNWQSHATRTSTYINSLGTAGFGMLFFNPSDRDAGYYEVVQGSNRWWDDTNVRQPTFNTMAAWMGSIVQQTQRRMMLWQVPNGNRVYRSENNTNGHYQDNRAEYFLNSTNGRQHIQQWANYGVVGIMYGAGVGSQTHYFDSTGDGITNPLPINGNDLLATLPDDDGGYLRLNLTTYYTLGTVALP